MPHTTSCHQHTTPPTPHTSPPYLNILICELLPQHVLVKRTSKVRIHQLPIVQRLAYDAPNKPEEIQVICAPYFIVLHHAVGVGLKGGARFWYCNKEGEIGVEYLPCHHLEGCVCVVYWCVVCGCCVWVCGYCVWVCGCCVLHDLCVGTTEHNKPCNMQVVVTLWSQKTCSINNPPTHTHPPHTPKK